MIFASCRIFDNASNPLQKRKICTIRLKKRKDSKEKTREKGDDIMDLGPDEVPHPKLLSFKGVIGKATVIR
jgi:hypothetical protein